MTGDASGERSRDVRPLMALAWTWVLLPFSYGIIKLLQRIDALFT